MSKLSSFVGRFFRGIWAIISGIYRIAVVIGILLFLACLWFALRGGPAVKVENNVALVIRPSGTLVEQRGSADFSLIKQFTSDEPSKTVVRDVIEALEDGAKDSRISVAVLKLDDLDSAGLPQIEEIAEAVKTFRAAGKHVYARGDAFDQSQYLLAASADDISLDPMGEVMMTGFGAYSNYFKEGLDKLGVEVNVFRVGEYKSAVEPFERNDMSPEARTANAAWLKDLWGDYNTRLAAARKLPGAPADAYIAGLASGLQSLKGDGAAYAKAQNLVDEVESLEDFRKRVGQKVGMDDDLGSFRQVPFQDYLREQHHRLQKKADDKIALITVEGDIVDGDGDADQAGGDTIADLLDDARRDDKVDAVVLRVNSPGGSVTGAEKMRRAVQAIQNDGTPVVVSMSNLAASGGYWISMDADEIWAHESTITGSIGIFGLIPTLVKPLEKLGIHTDGVGTTSLAGAFRSDRPLSPEVRTIIQSQIDFGYRQFIEGVANGRGIPVDQVDQLARGRVWSGSAAKELGLIDQIGGLEDAIKSAAGLANLKEGEYRVDEFKPQRGLARELFGELTGQSEDSRAPLSQLKALRALNLPLVDSAVTAAEMLRRFKDPKGEYAYCFSAPEISGGRR